MRRLSVHYSSPPKQTAKRLASHPGGPKLRAGKKYAATGFRAPPPGAKVSHAVDAPIKTVTSAVIMPKNFCYTAEDLTPALDQGTCGSCWAHALMFATADRVAIKTKGMAQRSLSVMQIMECSDYMQGCEPTGCGVRPVSR